MLENPFAVLERRLNRLESLLLELRDALPVSTVPAPADDLLNVKQAAGYLGIAPQTVYQNIGRLPHVKKHGRLYFRKVELLGYLEEGRVAQKNRA